MARRMIKIEQISAMTIKRFHGAAMYAAYRDFGGRYLHLFAWALTLNGAAPCREDWKRKRSGVKFGMFSVIDKQTGEGW